VVSRPTDVDDTLVQSADRPLASAACKAAAAPSSAHRSPAFMSTQVLIVDDNADAADSLALLLQLEGYRCTVAYSASEALAHAHHRHAAAILDVGLPDMTGYELVRRLRAVSSDDELFVVALTGYGSDKDKEQATLAGFDLHITKPARIDALAEALDRALARGPGVSS
jgi:CheY-like chemotaxis protein